MLESIIILETSCTIPPGPKKITEKNVLNYKMREEVQYCYICVLVRLGIQQKVQEQKQN